MFFCELFKDCPEIDNNRMVLGVAISVFRVLWEEKCTAHKSVAVLVDLSMIGKDHVHLRTSVDPTIHLISVNLTYIFTSKPNECILFNTEAIGG